MRGWPPALKLADAGTAEEQKGTVVVLAGGRGGGIRTNFERNCLLLVQAGAQNSGNSESATAVRLLEVDLQTALSRFHRGLESLISSCVIC